MATNLAYPNLEAMSLPVPSGTVSGEPVIAGTTPTSGTTIAVDGINGVALTDRSAGDPTNPSGYATVATRGAFRVSVATNVATTSALAIGDVVYCNITTFVLSSSVTNGAPWGRALEAKADNEAASTILVAIIPSI